MKKILTAMLLLLTSNLSAHDTDGFYVIPTGKVKTINQEVCNGTPVGDALFTIVAAGRFYLGDVYSTPNGFVIEIVGRSEGDGFYPGAGTISFNRTPKIFPSPPEGIKGEIYGLISGRVFHARIL